MPADTKASVQADPETTLNVYKETGGLSEKETLDTDNCVKPTTNMSESGWVYKYIIYL